jgi:branched-chain amino acid transport system permease protein
VSLNLANGFTGVFTLGQIGFMALGAYISAILTLPHQAKAAFLPDLPGWLAGVSLDQMVGPLPVGWIAATLIAALLVSGVAALVGAVLMRLSGPFVSVATLGFLVIVRVVLLNADSLTRGSRAFSNVTRYTDLWWAFGAAVVTVYVVWRIKRSSYGRAMFAQRASLGGQPVACPCSGRLQAFVISAFFTAAAGSLYAHFLGSFSPNAFYFDTTFQVVTMLVVGGMGSVSGSVIGAVAMLGLGEALRRFEDPTQLYGIAGIIIASILIATIVFRRRHHGTAKISPPLRACGGGRDRRQVTERPRMSRTAAPGRMTRAHRAGAGSGRCRWWPARAQGGSGGRDRLRNDLGR